MLALLATAGSLGAPGVQVGAAVRVVAQEAPSTRPAHIIEVKGWIDPVVADFVARSLAAAEEADAEVVVVQLDSPGALVGRQALDELAFRVSHAPVPVAVWIGPTGARARGGSARLVRAAAVTGMAHRTSISAEGADRAVGAGVARDQGLVDTVAPTLGEFLAGLDGIEVGGRVLDTAEAVTGSDGEARTQVSGEVRFAKLPLVERLLHAAASPSVAYLLLVAGLALIVFEFYSVGMGLAGTTGGLLLALAAYGLWVLPTTPVGLALVAVGMFGFAVDVQSGAPRAWTAIGTASLLAGSWWLFGDGITVPWLTLLAIVAGVVVLMVTGLPSMIRARFSTPTIGREWMIGDTGEAHTAVDPEGTVSLRGSLWRARTNRATPISEGDSIRVVSIDGLLLEVEPEEGGARESGH